MKNYFLYLIIFLGSSNCFLGQNNIYVGTNKYSSTNPWEFTINGNGPYGPASVTVAKKKGGGQIMLSMSSSKGALKGNVMIYLEDGSVIKCTDRGIKDEVDNQTIGVYYLTSSEMDLMKKSDISSIRFSLYEYPFGTKSYTMDNVYETTNFLPGGMPKKELKYKNSTAEDIKNIY